MSKLELNPLLLNSTLDAFAAFLTTHRRSAIEISIYRRSLLAFLSESTVDNSITLEESCLLPGFAEVAARFELDSYQASDAWSLWQEFVQLQVSGANARNLSSGATNTASSRINLSRDELLSRYLLALKGDKRSPSTIKNYAADLRAFFEAFGNETSLDFLTKPNVTKYLNSLKNGLSPSTIERKTTTLRQFFAWAKLKGYLLDNPLELPPIVSQEVGKNARPKSKLPRWILSYLSFRLTPYLHLALMMTFISLITFGAYKQFVLNVSLTQAFPTALTRPNRILSFQARLTNPSGTPITGTTPMSFRLYDASGGGTNLWSGSCSITPDVNGIFSTLLGSTCGAEIDSSVFSENAEVWLEVQVAAETLSPRQRLATVAYALNSETLQGYPPATPAQINTIPVVNNAGAIIIGAASPTLQSTNGTFAVQGDALVISTNTGSGGDITIAPDGTGQVNIIGGTTTDDTLTIRNANLSSGNLVTGIVSNNNTGYKFLSFQGGSSPSEKFSVNAVGNVVAVGTYTGRGAILTATAGTDVPLQVNGTGGNVLSVANGGDITHAIGANIKPNTDSTTALNIANAAGTRYVTFDSSNQRVGIGTTSPGTALDVTGQVTVSSLNTPGGIIYDTNSSGTLGVSAAGTSGQCLVSGGTGAPTWSSCGSGGSGENFWRIENGAISPINDTLDLLIGSNATGSAAFGFLNVNSGTPTFQIDGNSVLTSTTLGSTVVNSSLTSVGALSSGSITTGFGTISTTNTITGTVINGTTGINTGAGAGTQRIDASGNLVNINDITAAGTVTITSLPTAGAVLYTAAGGVVSQTAAGTSGQCLVSGGAGSPTWTSCSAAANNYWQLNGEVLSPGNTTWDIAVGGTATSSALFQVFGDTGNATTSGNITFAGTAATNVIAARNMAGITIGDAQTGNITIFGLGTGVVHSTDGVLSSSAIDLTTDVTGVLPIANGGTNTSTIGGAGSIAYSNGTNYAFSSVGTLGQCLVSGGTGAPTWTSCASAAQNYWQNDGTTIAPANTTWNLAIGGESTASAKFFIDGGNGNASTSGNFIFGGTSVTNLIAARNMAGLTIGDSETGNININNNGFVGIHNANPTATLDVTGTVAISSTLTLSGYPSCNGLTTTAGGVVQCNTNPFANVNFWQLNNNVLSPANSTWDIAVGGTATSSALFQVFANTGLASTSGGLTFSGSSTNYMNVLNNQSLTIRNSPGGDAGLVDRVTILNNGNVGIGDTTPNALLTVGSGDLFQVNSAGAITASTGIATTGDISITSINPRIFYFDSSAGDDDFLTFVDADTYAVQNNTTGDTYLSLSPSTLALGNNTVTKNIRIGGVTTSATDTVSIATNGTLADTITIGNTNAATNLSFFSKNVALTTSGQLSLGSNTTLAPLYVTNGFGANAAFILNQLNAADILTASASGVTRMTLSNAGLLTLSAYNTAGAVVYTDANGTLSITAQGTTGQCLVSGGSGSPSWTSCASTNYWQLDPTSTVLSPGNSTWDLAVGGIATDSSKFQIAGLTGNATTSGNLTFYGGTSTTNLIAARADAGLFIGDSQTGNVIINPDGNIGIKNLTPLATLDVTGTASISSTLTMGGAIQPAIGPLTLNYKSGPNAWAAALTIQSDTGNVGIGITNPTATLHVVGTLTQSGGNVSINDSGSTTTSIGSGTNTGTITIGGGATTQSIALGTGAGAKTVDIGSSNTTSITRIVSGSGGVLINDSINQPVGIGTTTSTGTITIGGSADQTINIGNGAAAKTVNLGSSTTTSTTTLLSGSGGLNLNVNNNQPTNINTGTSTGTVTIGGGSATIKLNLGSDATGDIFYRNSSGNVARLGIGSTGQVLVVSSGLPSWGGGVTPGDGTVGWWQRNLGVLAPTNITDDLAIGGTATSSALFQVFGDTGNATTSGTFTFGGTAATNVIAARSMEGITIGDAETGNITIFGLGTGVVHSTGGVLSSSDVDLTTEVTGVLPIANGGTNASTIGGAGSIAYSTGTAYAFSAAGTGGECLVSGGTGSPTWSTCGGANFWQLNNNVLSPGNSTWDLAIGGDSTSSAKFQVFADSGDATMSGNLYIGEGKSIRPANGALQLDYKSGPNSWTAGLVIQSTTGNVGIGTTNPQARLDIGGATSTITNTSGDITIDAASNNISLNGDNLINFTQTLGSLGSVSLPTYSFSGDGNTGIYSAGPDTLRFATGGLDRMAIDANGLIGIGTIAPVAPLHISSGYGSNAAFIVNQLNSGDLMAASASGTTRFRIDNSGNVIAASFQDIANTAYFLDPANAGTSLTVAGKVGIGTTNPTFMLETTGQVTGKALAVFNETGNQSILVASSSGTRVFEIGHDGELTIGNVAKADVPVTLYGDIFQQANTSLTSGTGATDVFVYDTTKDSDAGAWTDSTLSRQLSWYTETKDDGPADLCDISTDDRCGQSAFPKKATIVTNGSGGWYIYDTLSNKMWMKGTGATVANKSYGTYKAAFMKDGILYLAANNGTNGTLRVLDFKNDQDMFITTTGMGYGTGNGGNTIALRDTEGTSQTTLFSTVTISNQLVNDVHVNTPEGVTIIAVATEGGLSVINMTDKRTVNLDPPESTAYTSTWVTKAGELYGVNKDHARLDKWIQVQRMRLPGVRNNYVDKTWGAASTPALAASTPTITANTPSALYVAEASSQMNPSGNTVYVGTNQGLTTISDKTPSGGSFTNGGFTYATTGQAQLPFSAYAHAVTTTQIGATNYLYHVGGYDGAGRSAVYKSTIDSLGNVGTWATTSQGQLPVTRYYTSVETARISGTSYIYLLGGFDTATNYFTTVYKATIDSSGNVGTWATTGQGQLPLIYAYSSGRIAEIEGNHYFYTFGGLFNGVVSSAVYRAAIDSSGNVGTWATTGQGQLPAVNELGTATFARVNGKNYAYMVGGYNGSSIVSTVYKAEIDPGGNIGTFTTTNQAQLPEVQYINQVVAVNANGQHYLYTIGHGTKAYRANIDKDGNVGNFTSDAGSPPQSLNYLNNTLNTPIVANGQQNIYVIGGNNGVAISTVYKIPIAGNEGSAKYMTKDYTSEQMVGDVRGMWPLSSDLASSSGTLIGQTLDATNLGNHLNEVNRPTFTSGVRGFGLNFNSSSQQHLSCTDANCGGINKLDPGYGPFSMGVWLKTTKVPSQILIAKGTAVPYAYQFYLHDGSPRYGLFRTIDGGFHIDASASARVNDGQWHHVIGTYDGYNISVIIDGVQQATSNVKNNTQTTDSSGNFQIGARTDESTTYFNGQMDEPFVTASPITVNQALRMYESGRQALKKRTITVDNATTATSTTIGDSGETWTPNEFVGAIVELTGGTGSGQTRTVISNTSTVLTVSPAFTTTPDTTTDFAIRPHELYGATNNVTAVALSTDPANNQRFLYVGSNSGTGTGGVTQFDADADVTVDQYHNDAGKTDEVGNAWSTTSSNDDINSVAAASKVLAIGSTNLYWQNRQGLQVTAELDRLQNQITALQQQSAANGMAVTAATSTGLNENYQVIRKGWGSIYHLLNTNATGVINFGITYDEPPAMFMESVGYYTTIPPSSLTDCANSSTVEENPYNIGRSQASFQSRGHAEAIVNAFHCYTWMTIGTVSNLSGTGSTAGFAAGADLAEWYPTNDATLKAGEVVSIASSGNIRVERTNKDNKNAAIGIISTRPATILGDQSGLTPGYKEDEFEPGASTVAVALSGRVPVKVSLENGDIKAGDFLAPASIPGYVAKAITAGPVVGKAMEVFDGTNTISDVVTHNATESAIFSSPKKEDQVMRELDMGRGVIMAFVQNGYWDPDSGFTAGELATNFSIHTSNASESALLAILPYQLRGPLGQIIDKVVTASNAMIANLEAGFIRTRDLVAERFSIGNSTLTAQKSDDGGENLRIQLGNKDASGSATNTLTIADRYSNPVATIDEQGNASFSGKLTAKNGLFEGLSLNDASISGTLYAQNIAGLREKVEGLVAERLASGSSLFAYDAYPSLGGEVDPELLASITDTNAEVMSRIAALESDAIASGSSLLASASLSEVTIDSTLLLDRTGINSVADTLAIQGSGHGTINFLAGAMTLDAEGLIVNTDAFFARSVTIKEDLMVNVIRSLNGDVSIHLATPSSELSDRLAIMNNQTQEVASIDASGSARFNKLIIASDRQDPNRAATISGQYSTNASTGESVLPAGTQSLKIISPKISEDSLVYVTPTSSTSNQVLYVSSKHVADPNVPGDYSYFYVSLDNTLAIPVTFNWWIIN